MDGNTKSNEYSIEPIAIVGMACRLPGGITSPDDLWNELLAGTDLCSDLPDGRWDYAISPETKSILEQTTKRGYFLDDIHSFDSDFFTIPPWEAETMDPQQRLVLELVWEALESGGQATPDLAGSSTGVYVGVGATDFGNRKLSDLNNIVAWTGVGSSPCGVANRVSYCLDLRGPSVALDTACSASLVAVHSACQALRNDEITMAVAGGANIIAAPGFSITLDAAGAMSSDGRCKSFDESADGYGRAEGGGIVVLKRLPDALAANDNILGLIVGSGVGQEGRTNGIMAPSTDAQEALLRKTYAASGLDPRTVGYIEAHGTGTPLGDPTEVRAISKVFAGGRDSDAPCLIGSVKANVGHLEAGSGVISLIKSLLVLKHGTIPRQINFTTPTSRIDWAGSGVRVVDQHTDMPTIEGHRRIGISGYGYGGTIGHLVIEGTSPRNSVPAPSAENGTRLVPVTGRTADELREWANSLAEHLDQHRDGSFDDVAHTLAARRDHREYRSVLAVSDYAQLLEGLRNISLGDDVIVGRASEPRSGTVWIYSGHGAHWDRVGTGLLEVDCFTKIIDEIDPIFEVELGMSCRSLIESAAPAETYAAQALTFAIQCGLTEVWQSYGVRPAAVIGHSLGEIAAAVTAGVLTVADGARLACRRALVVQKAAGKGAMLAVGRGASELEHILPDNCGVTVAINSSPDSSVVSGSASDIEEVAPILDRHGIRWKRVATDVAFHSYHMDPLVDDLMAAVCDLPVHEPKIPMYSAVLPDPRTDAPRDAAYWAANLRAVVRLESAVRAAIEDGHNAFLEISGHPIVSESVMETAEAMDRPSCVGHSIRRNKPELAIIRENVSYLFTEGVEIAWRDFTPGRLVELPGHRWDRRQYPDTAIPLDTVRVPHHTAPHSLIGQQNTITTGDREIEFWRSAVSYDTRPYGGIHEVDGVEVVPASIIVNSFITALFADHADRPVSLRSIEFTAPLILENTKVIDVVNSDNNVTISSRPSSAEPGAKPRLHARASRPDRQLIGVSSLFDWAAARERCSAPIDPGELPGNLARRGIVSSAFQWTIKDLRLGRSEVVAQISVEEPCSWAPILDAAFTIPMLVSGTADRSMKMISGVQQIELRGPFGPEIMVHAAARPGLNDVIDISISDDLGRIIAHLGGAEFVDAPAFQNDTGDGTSLYLDSWCSVSLGSVSTESRDQKTIMVVGDGSLAARVRDGLAALPVRVTGHKNIGQLQHPLDADIIVIYVPNDARGDERIEQAIRRSANDLHALLRLATSAVVAPKVWLMTTGIRENRSESTLPAAATKGIVQSVYAEYRDAWGGAIDLPATLNDSEFNDIWRLINEAACGEIFSLADGQISQYRISRQEPIDNIKQFTCSPDATYVVSGGESALGIKSAEWLAAAGARSIILLSDASGADGAAVAAPLVQNLRSRGVDLHVATVSFDQIDAVRQAIDGLRGDLPVGGVVHAVHPLEVERFGPFDDAEFATLLAAAIEPARTLHTIFPPSSVAFFVLNSPAVHTLCVGGCHASAAVSAYFDGLARLRATAGSSISVSLGWSPWPGLLTESTTAAIQYELRSRGMELLDEVQAAEAWRSALSGGNGGSIAVLNPGEPGTQRFSVPALESLHRMAVDQADSARPASFESTIDEVSKCVARETKLSLADISPGLRLSDIGSDSVLILAMRRTLERRFAVRIPTRVMWEGGTVEAIARYIMEVSNGG
ncbi:beta-ketoacyl synthase N-terminal-like domain-containing protein [Nocardia sp. NPDC051052]|uniref:beta-ketoacyl synthase N-terminal-like domain-containing protein n=1 Tax=Nocardia sp. NPDC051052 TaxID=3364322 RepID=UPI00379E1CD4